MASPKVVAIQLRARQKRAFRRDGGWWESYWNAVDIEALEIFVPLGVWRARSNVWLGLSCRLVCRPAVEEDIRKAGRWPSDMKFEASTFGTKDEAGGRGEDKRAKGSCW
jgi:hypothetical protein